MFDIGMMDDAGNVTVLPPLPKTIELAALTDFRDGMDAGLDPYAAIQCAAINAGFDCFTETGDMDSAMKAEGIITAWLVATVSEIILESDQD